jgi:DNA-binding transcriptional LysR family regulator
MSITLKQLEAFYWAAKLGTFSIAAERLHVTQSSLSKRIAELEAGLGRELFDRSRKRAVLTAQGETLLLRAGEILDLTQLLASELGAEGPLSGVCSFGVSEQASTTWFPAFMDRLRAKFPDLVARPRVGLGRSLERLVLRGELDFAVIPGVSSLDGVGSEAVGAVEFEWMSSPRRMARDRRVTAATFAQHPVILSTADSGVNLPFEQWAAAHGLTIAQSITCNSLTAIVGLAVAGQGISLLPRHYVQPLVDRKLLVTLRSAFPFPPITYSFVFRKDDHRRVIREMHTLVRAEVDFTVPNALWSL